MPLDDALPADEPERAQLGRRERDEARVVAAPQIVARPAEVLDAEERLRRVDTRPGDEPVDAPRLFRKDLLEVEVEAAVLRELVDLAVGDQATRRGGVGAAPADVDASTSAGAGTISANWAMSENSASSLPRRRRRFCRTARSSAITSTLSKN